jgi:superfamily II DNA or RNA helicase
MQALCRSCNLKKGKNMQCSMVDVIDLSEARPGQREAFSVLCERVRQGEATTAIVLPTRYGKSDVMRLASIQLLSEGIISKAFILSPQETLRKQVVTRRKIDEMNRRYKVMFKPGMRTLATWPGDKSLHRKITPNDESIVSTTIQLMNSWRDAQQGIVDYFESLKNRTGKNALVCIDEAHTVSSGNEWGKTIAAIKDYVHVALFTATPVRETGTLYGFRYETAKEEEITQCVTRPGKTEDTVIVDLYSGTRSEIRLIPDHETTFADAWAETPSPLCEVSRLPVDVDMEKIEAANVESGVKLSELSETEARRVLRVTSRDTMVIHEVCRQMIAALQLFRQRDERCAAMVFCGNDTGDDDSQTNEHAKRIQKVIAAMDSSLNVLIATSKSGSDNLDDFANEEKNKGDVIIVKQMGGAGLDVGRVKVVADLSSVRTYGACIQRWLRGATIFSPIRHMVLVTLDDILSRANFEKVVGDVGGQTVTSLQELLSSYEKERVGSEKPTYVPISARHSDFEDNARNQTEASRLDSVQALCKVFAPHETRSYSQISNLMDSLGMQIVVKEPLAGAHQNTDETVRQYQESIINILDGIKPSLQREVITNPHKFPDVDAGTVTSRLYVYVFRMAGITGKASVRKVENIEDLRRLKRAALMVEQDHRKGEVTACTVL